MSLLEGQASLSAFYLLDGWVPYIGVKGSELWVHLEKLKGVRPFFSNERVKLSNRHKVDLILGVGFSGCAILGLNVELRMIDDKAITLTGELRF